MARLNNLVGNLKMARLNNLDRRTILVCMYVCMYVFEEPMEPAGCNKGGEVCQCMYVCTWMDIRI